MTTNNIMLMYVLLQYISMYNKKNVINLYGKTTLAAYCYVMYDNTNKVIIKDVCVNQ